MDVGDQLARDAHRGNEVEEPPTARQLGIQSQDPSCQDVAAPEVIEQPAVETKISQAPLNCAQVEHHHPSAADHWIWIRLPRICLVPPWGSRIKSVAPRARRERDSRTSERQVIARLAPC